EFLYTGRWVCCTVSVNSFLDTLGPKMMRHPPRHSVAHVAPGQGLCRPAVPAATSPCLDAGTRAARGGVLPQSHRWCAITDAPSVSEESVPHRRCLRVRGQRRAHG